MVTLQATQAEIDAGILSPERQAKALKALKEDGIVVIEDVIEPAHIAALRQKMLADVDAYVNRPDAPYNWNKGNIQQDPPPYPPYLFRDVLANSIAIELTHAILGDGMYNAFYSGNTAMPSDCRQPVHADIGHLWQNMETVHPAYALVVNVPVVDMGPENGSTEVWPGTHRDPTCAIQDGFIEIPIDKQQQWNNAVQPVVRAGGIVIRDIRMWHAGMPNKTQQPRPMIAMIHYVNWWPCAPIKLHRSAEELLRHPKLRQHAEYFDDESIDYISAVGGYKSEDA